MEVQAVQLYQEAICCPICLDPLRDAVTIPCGHSYCMSCVQSHWDREEDRDLYSCPQCRQVFSPRPVLVRSTMLSVLVEELKKTGLPAAPADHSYARPGDVACYICTGRRLKAARSCLDCLVSYCETHLEPHYCTDTLQTHRLVEPSEELQQHVCCEHDQLKTMFCRKDQQLVCHLCPGDQHQGHDIVSAEAERAEKQKELEENQQTIEKRVQDKEKDLEVLQQEMQAVRCSADEAIEASDGIFTQIIQFMRKKQLEVERLVRARQQIEEMRVQESQERLEQEITELKRKHSELKALSGTSHHSHFLHDYLRISKISEPKDSPRIYACPLRHFEDVIAPLSELKDNLQRTANGEWVNITDAISEVDVLLSSPRPVPKTREEFLKYARNITFDVNTAHTLIELCDGNRTAVRGTRHQPYPKHPDRFTDQNIVLSRESLSGRCYWEVEWSNARGVTIMVTYKDIDKERYYCSHDEDKSWGYYVYNSKSKREPYTTIGVFLDHRAGVVSFYGVSETMICLKKVKTSFTQPLYAGISFRTHGEVATFLKLK